MKVENVEIEETQSSTSISCRLEVKSSTIDYQNCPICLCPFDSDALARLDACSHKFCFDCIQEWSKKINTCPIDRKKYTYIEFRTKKGLTKRIKVEDRTNLEQEEGPNDLTYCEVCHLSNREDRMLLCDGCDRGFHCECLRPAIENIPNGDWYCPRCVEIRTSVNDSFHHDHFSSEIGPTTSQRAEQRQQQPRIIARTNYAERVRRNVSQRRKTTKTARRKPKQRRKKRKVGVKRRRTTTRKTTTKKRVVKKTSTKLSASRLASIKKVRTYRRRRKTTKKRKTGSSAIKRRTLTLNSIKIKRKVLNRPKQRIITKFIRKSDEKKVFNPRAPAETALVNNVTSDLMSDYVFRDLPCTSRDSDLNSDLKPKNIPMTTTNQQQPKTSSSSSSGLNLFDSILSDFKLLHKKSEEIQVKTDGSLNVVNRPKLTLKSVNSISSTSESLIKRLKREDSNGEPKTSVDVSKNEPTSHDLRSSHSHSQEITTNILQRQKSSSNPSTSTTAQNTSQTKIKKEFSIKEEKLDDELKSQKLNQPNKNKPASDENQSSSKKIRKEQPLTEAIILGYQKPTTSAAANRDTNTIMKPTSHSVNQTKIKREFSIKDEKLPLPVNNGKTHEQMKSQINSNTATKPTENMAVNHQIKIKEEKLAPEELTNKINQGNNKAENQASSKQIKQEAVENEEPLTEASILGFDKPTKNHRSKNNEDQSAVKTVALKVEKVEPSTSKQATILSRDRIIEIAKETLKPFYAKQLINKDTYKYIMKRVVEKTMEQIQQGSSSICEDKIAKLVKQYAEKSSAHKS